MQITGKGTETNTYDAIVVGSGISGGWAAKELSERGLKTLVLERGRDVKHGDYPTANLDLWDMEGRGKLSKEALARQPKQSRTGYTTNRASAHWFVDDIDHPYNEDKRFDWMRGYHVGGRSLMWGRQSYRWSELDFEANAKEGIATDWPIRYKDIAPWYDYVETFAGISGQAEGLPQLPDGKFLPPMEMSCLETHVKERIEKNFNDRIMTIGRTANLTQPHNGRASCQYRNRCIRGCPYGAYFSSNAATLPAAYATGNMTLRPFSIVHQVIYDKKSGKASGVRVIDTETNEHMEFYAKVIFLCASAVASTFILMNSKSDRFPNGMGNESGELGHNVMDHHFRVGAAGIYEGMEDKYYVGRRANGIYIPRFRNVNKATEQKDFLRGYGYQGRGSRTSWSRGVKELAKFGLDMKTELFEPGPWRFGITAFGEALPDHDNYMYLDYDKVNKWGLPTITFHAEFKENEMKMREDMKQQAAEMLEAAGLKQVATYDSIGAPGLGIHEMGTARMGTSPKNSVLNRWNQVHNCKNVFVTDGACMTSASCVNPSLTYMALTARAAEYAVSELNKQNL
ncbi:MAG: GMC family oxidoreductase [Bacteroidota bacterium]